MDTAMYAQNNGNQIKTAIVFQLFKSLKKLWFAIDKIYECGKMRVTAESAKLFTKVFNCLLINFLLC